MASTISSTSNTRATVTFIHTVAALVPTFAELADELLPPGTQVFNIVDDSLLTVTRHEGSVSALTKRRLAGHIWSATEAGADAILVSCSSMGGAVDQLRPLCAVPLLRVDEPMAEKAVGLGSKVGVLATLATTLGPTTDLVRTTAARLGTVTEIVDVVCPGAFDAVTGGNLDLHDAIVGEQLVALASRVDVVILAQASMARVAQGLDRPLPVPVLSSPRSAVSRLAEIINSGDHR